MKYERNAAGWFPGAEPQGECAAPCGYCPAPTCESAKGHGCRGAHADRFITWAKANPEAYEEYAEETRRACAVLKRELHANYARARGWN